MYLIVQVRKRKPHKWWTDDFNDAKSMFKYIHNCHRYSLPETYLYIREDGDWKLLEIKRQV